MNGRYKEEQKSRNNVKLEEKFIFLPQVCCREDQLGAAYFAPEYKKLYREADILIHLTIVVRNRREKKPMFVSVILLTFNDNQTTCNVQ